MRRFSLIAALTLCAFPATALASAGAVGDGSLMVANANVKAIVVVGHGLIYGYVDQGAVTVISYTPDDTNQFQISGAAAPTRPASGGARYAGSAMRFLISGTYSLKFEGSGINISAVGKGTVFASGGDTLTPSSPGTSLATSKSAAPAIGGDSVASSTSGTLTVNGGRPQTLGRSQTVASFGSAQPTTNKQGQ